MASAADSVSKPIPTGAIHSAEFNPSSIDPNTHLFFDDDRKYIDPVQETMNARGLPLACVYCPPPKKVVLHTHDTGAAVEITRPYDFSSLKQQGLPRGVFRDFVGEHIEREIGTGFTSAMIAQLIEIERGASPKDKQRLYFFDFDKTLTFAPGVTYAFFPKEKSKTRTTPDKQLSPAEIQTLSQYVKYLISDYCGEEPAEGGRGRLRLLRELFGVIGVERIYIVTANKSALNVPENPYYLYFKMLIRELFPTFLEDHIIGVQSTNVPPLFNNKQDAIASIIERTPRSPHEASVTHPSSPSREERGGRKSRKVYRTRYSRRSTRNTRRSS